MSKIKDVYNLECKVFEPETADLSEKEIKVLLKQLYGVFPHIKSVDGDREPYPADGEYSKKWFQSYNHLLMLLEMKKQDAKHKISMWLSGIAIVISIISIVVSVLTE